MSICVPLRMRVCAWMRAFVHVRERETVCLGCVRLCIYVCETMRAIVCKRVRTCV
jgi:hypothetical protein